MRLNASRWKEQLLQQVLAAPPRAEYSGVDAEVWFNKEWNEDLR